MKSSIYRRLIVLICVRVLVLTASYIKYEIDKPCYYFLNYLADVPHRTIVIFTKRKIDLSAVLISLAPLSKTYFPTSRKFSPFPPCTTHLSKHQDFSEFRHIIIFKNREFLEFRGLSVLIDTLFFSAANFGALQLWNNRTKVITDNGKLRDQTPNLEIKHHAHKCWQCLTNYFMYIQSMITQVLFKFEPFVTN